MALEEYVRPQKHRSWFNVAPVRDVVGRAAHRVPFLESFVTIESAQGEPGYAVRYEGVQPMCVTIQFGFVCVWFGEDLTTPEWPFPTLFDHSYGHDYIITRPRVFKSTNLLDLIENNGDPVHFKTVHQWLTARIWDHEYTEQVFRLKMSGEVQYGRSADSALKRRIANLLPSSSYSQELAFHGPGFGAGKIRTSNGVEANLVLAFTPVGDNDLKLHVATSVDVAKLPPWLQGLFRLSPLLSLHDLLAWVLGRAGLDDTDGDYRIWRHKKSLKDPKLLPGEADILRIREWMSQYYMSDFAQPAPAVAAESPRRWALLGFEEEIETGKVNSFEVEGEELVAIRTSSGDVRVFEAHCPHQGAHLGQGGHVKDDCVACPFHLFYFNTDGHFVGSDPRGKPKPLMQLNRIEHRTSCRRIEVWV